MIDKTKNSVADKSFYFLLWGWLVFTAALLQFILKVIVRTDAHPVAWNIMFIGIIISIFHGVKEKGRRRVKTYMDETLGYIWTCVAFSQGVLVFIFMQRGGWENCYSIFMLLYAIGCFTTGRILKFAPLVWGAIACWLLAIGSTFTSYDYNILLLATAILVSYIIPGHLLRAEYKKTIIKAV